MNYFKNKKIPMFVVFVIFVVFFAMLLSNYLSKQSQISTPKNFFTDLELREQAIQRIPELKSKVESEPTNPDFKRDLSRAYYLIGDFSASEKLIQESINLNPENPQYYVDLGLLYEVKRDYVKAEEMYKKAVELNTREIEIENPSLKIAPPKLRDKLKKDLPSSTSTYLLVTPYTALVELYIDKLNKIDEAISVLGEGVKINPDYPDFYYMLSTAHAKKGDVTKAEEYMQKFNDLISKPTSTPTPPVQ